MPEPLDLDALRSMGPCSCEWPSDFRPHFEEWEALIEELEATRAERDYAREERDYARGRAGEQFLRAEQAEADAAIARDRQAEAIEDYHRKLTECNRAEAAIARVEALVDVRYRAYLGVHEVRTALRGDPVP